MKDILGYLAILAILVLFGPIAVICACIGKIPLGILNPIFPGRRQKFKDIPLEGKIQKVLVTVVGIVVWVVVWGTTYFILCSVFPNLPICPGTPTPCLICYQVRVQMDSAEDAEVEVRIEVNGKAPIIVTTRANSVAEICVPCSYAGQPAVLIAEANGYKYRQDVELTAGAFPSLISLLSETPPCKSPGSSGPFSVYPNYGPSGYMGDIGDITVEKGPEVVRFIYEIRGRGPHEWEWKYVNCKTNLRPCQFAGVMYLNPPSNWGEISNGGFNLQGFRCVRWEARSVTGTVNVEFVIGGIEWKWDDQEECPVRVPVPYPGSMPRVSLGIKTLTEHWQSFEYDLSDNPKDDFRCVVGGFAWIISWGSNQVRLNEAGTGPKQPKTFTIEIRNIRYER